MTTGQERDEILFGRSPTLKVFISSRMRGGVLAAERAAAAEAVDAHPDADAWLWERSANAGPFCSLEVCRGNAATSDVLLLIVSDELTAPTEIEWRAAKKNGAVCALFVKEGVTRDPGLEAFITAESDSSIYVRFGSPSELQTRIHDTLRQSHTHAVRRAAVGRRISASTTADTGVHLVEIALDAAEEQLWTGSATEALKVLEDVELLVEPSGRRPDGLDLVSGLVHAHLGENDRAVAAFERVIAEDQSSPHAVAVAYQSLGIEAMKSRDLSKARDHMWQAFELHKEVRDMFGMLQMTLNFATLAVENQKLDEGTEFVDFAERLIRTAAEPLPSQIASVHGIRGLIAVHEGDLVGALAFNRKAYELSVKARNRDSQIVAAQNLGSVYADSGRYALSLRWYRRALELAEDAGNAWRKEELHRSIGLVAYRRRDLTAAVAEFETARALAGQMGDRWRAATLTADIGGLLLLAEDPRAGRELDRAATELAELADTKWLHRVEQNRAALARDHGDIEAACLALNRALTYADDAPADLQQTQEALAEIYSVHLGDPETAADHYRAAATGSGLVGAELAWTRASYGMSLADARHLSSALNLLDEAVIEAEQSGDPETTFHVRHDRGIVLAELGELEVAESVFRQGVAEARRMSNRVLERQALSNLGEIQRRLDRLDDSAASLGKAIARATELGDEDSARSARGLLALTEVASGHLDVAEDHANEVLHDHGQHSTSDRALAFSVLGAVAFRRAEYTKAAHSYRAAARMRSDDPIHRAESLGGVLEALSAAGQWRPAVRAAQRLVDFAQEHRAETVAWEALLRGARWFLDRGQLTRAAQLVVPGLVVAWNESGPAPGYEEPEQESTKVQGLYRAVLMVAFHVRWSDQDGVSLWSLVVEAIAEDDPDVRDTMKRLIATATEQAGELDSERAERDCTTANSS